MGQILYLFLAHLGIGARVIGTVTGDLHDIGKNLVVTMLKGVGFDVVDLGVNVSRDRFCEAVEELEPDAPDQIELGFEEVDVMFLVLHQLFEQVA